MTNEQAQGYVLLACKELGISRKEAEKFIFAMKSGFDFYSEDEAQTKGFDWLYERENQRY